jgi:signal transduction histidine kinase
VRRIVGLVTRISEASRAAVTMDALAATAARVLVELFPECTVVLFERHPTNGTARVVGGANVPEAWQARGTRLKDIPLLEEALNGSDRVVKCIVQSPALAGAGSPCGRWQAFCAAVPDADGALYALLFVARAAPDEADVHEAAVETTRRLLAASAAIRGHGRARALAAIYRAKLEWEQTADTLPEIVGLLDTRWRVVRLSRAIERWQLGSVRGAIGRNLHAILHRSCTGADCLLSASLDAAMVELRSASRASFEVHDRVLSLDLSVSLNADTVHAPRGSRRSQRIVFIVTNVTSLRNAERELRSLNRTLEQRVAERTQELLATNGSLRSEVIRRREAEKSLQRSTRDLEALSERLMTAQEAERKRIAQEMHDSVGQTLSAIKYSLERAQVLVAREDTAEASNVVELSILRVQQLMEEVRTISMNLRPAMLDDLGAASAVRGLCRDWQDVYRGINVETDIGVADTDIPPVLVTHVFRAVQESLNNVARHAAAQRVQVSMRIFDGVLEVAIRDDGSGFKIDNEWSPAVGARGLMGLRERAARTGGCCEVSSALGQGTTVQLKWPVAAGHAAQLVSESIH